MTSVGNVVLNGHTFPSVPSWCHGSLAQHESVCIGLAPGQHRHTKRPALVGGVQRQSLWAHALGPTCHLEPRKKRNKRTGTREPSFCPRPGSSSPWPRGEKTIVLCSAFNKPQQMCSIWKSFGCVMAAVNKTVRNASRQGKSSSCMHFIAWLTIT